MCELQGRHILQVPCCLNISLFTYALSGISSCAVPDEALGCFTPGRPSSKTFQLVYGMAATCVLGLLQAVVPERLRHAWGWPQCACGGLNTLGCLNPFGTHVQVACGGHHTLAVCRHDADREDTEERRRGYKGKMRAWFANTNAALDGATMR